MNQDINIVKTIDGKVKNAQNDRLFIFCHFSASNLIADYVVKYLEDLSHNCCGDIVFVSNCTELKEAEISKIEHLASKIIIRKNVGYDFGAYFSGYLSIDDFSKYKQIIFANDSVYGPFYSLNKVFEEMESKKLDAWSITDNCLSEYSLQSYFLCFNANLKGFLDEYFTNFKLYDKKEEAVHHYEIKLSKDLILKNYRISALCNHNDIIADEFTSKDETLKQVKKSIRKSFFYKPSIKKLFSRSYNRNLKYKKFLDLYSGPHHKCWYSLIAKFNCPFIKVSLVNDKKLIPYHNFLYKGVIEKLYPDFDFHLISKDIICKK